MLKTKIKISEVTNLTDARYFAAMGVDYLGFQVYPEDPHFVSPQIAGQIANWVEGPEIVLDLGKVFDEVHLEDYRRMVGDFYLESSEFDLQPDFLVIRNAKEAKNLAEESFLIYQPGTPWRESRKETIDLANKFKNRLFLDLDFEPDQLSDIMDNGVHGIILRGGEEEKVGYKSYEELDEIFEKLMM